MSGAPSTPDVPADQRSRAEAREGAIGALFPIAYATLRSMAARLLAVERKGHTLQGTALVHEAYMRLAGQHQLAGADRIQILSAAAVSMRRVLVEHARKRRRRKRHAPGVRVTLSVVDEQEPDRRQEPIDALALHDALVRLAEHGDRAERAARVVELRYFGGLEVGEAATALGISARTAALDWKFARAWLLRELGA